MTTKIKHEWEELDGVTYRCKVIGGWLVQVSLEKGEQITTSVTFVPDTFWEWEVE
jgi:hypothetical protein